MNYIVISRGREFDFYFSLTKLLFPFTANYPIILSSPNKMILLIKDKTKLLNTNYVEHDPKSNQFYII